MTKLTEKLYAAYVDIVFAAKAHDITPGKALAITVFGAVAACLPAAFIVVLGSLYQSTHCGDFPWPSK